MSVSYIMGSYQKDNRPSYSVEQAGTLYHRAQAYKNHKETKKSLCGLWDAQGVAVLRNLRFAIPISQRRMLPLL